MFSDRSAFDQPTVGFPSDWRKTLSLKEGSCQTDELKVIENETQTNTKAEIGIQVEEPEKSTEEALKRLNSPSLVKFLVRATPMIENELEGKKRVSFIANWTGMLFVN